MSKVTIPSNEWTKIASGINSARLAPVSTNPTRYYYDAVELNGAVPPADLSTGIVLSEERAINYRDAIDLYVYALNYSGIVDYDEDGPFVETAEQDQYTDPLEMYLSRKITTTALSSNIPINTGGDPWEVTETSTITVDDATGAAVGLWVEIWSATEKYQGEIGNVAGNVLTLKKPIGIPFTTSDVVYIIDVDQNKNFLPAGIGNQYYTFDPPSIYTGDTHVYRIMVTMLHTNESDSSLYGDILKLTNGVVFSGRSKAFARETGLAADLVAYNNIFNIRDNQDYKSIAYDVSFEPKSGNPAAGTLYGTTIRKSFAGPDKSGVVVPVFQARNQAIRALFRDNLSTFNTHRIRVIGHKTA